MEEWNNRRIVEPWCLLAKIAISGDSSYQTRSWNVTQDILSKEERSLIRHMSDLMIQLLWNCLAVKRYKRPLFSIRKWDIGFIIPSVLLLMSGMCVFVASRWKKVFPYKCFSLVSTLWYNAFSICFYVCLLNIRVYSTEVVDCLWISSTFSTHPGHMYLELCRRDHVRKQNSRPDKMLALLTADGRLM